MKNLIFTIILTLSISLANSQSVGFSYFFPKNGYFSNPIAPVSLSIPLKFGNNFLIGFGFSYNNIGGMSMGGFGENYKSNLALMGPFQSLTLKASPTIRLNFKKAKLDLIGGGFALLTFNEKLIKGNFDEMMMMANNYQMINSKLDFNKSLFGSGYFFGSKFIFHAKNKVWLYLGANYYIGSKNYTVDYEYFALKSNSIVEGSGSFNKSFLQYEGTEIILGVILKK